MADRPAAQSAPPPRSQTDAVVPVTVGTALWGVGLVVTLVVRPTLVEHGTQWWVWTCATGVVLGIFGCWWVRRRRSLLDARGEAGAAQPDQGPPDPAS